jgi:threonine dehydratase
MVISKQDIINVKNNISDHIIKTPVLSFELINKICNCEVFFKCENFQSSGSFKYRAALNAIKNLPIKFKKTGIITHSS